MNISIKKIKGFTLIELLVVIAIVGILATVILGSVNRGRTKAESIVLLKEAQEFQKAVHDFRFNKGRFPTAGSSPHPTLIFPVASYCDIAGPGSWPYDNWQETVADMGEYLAPILNAEGEFPGCLSYMLGQHPECAVSDSEFFITFDSGEHQFDGIDYYVNENTQKNRGCLYEI